LTRAVVTMMIGRWQALQSSLWCQCVMLMALGGNLAII